MKRWEGQVAGMGEIRSVRVRKFRNPFRKKPHRRPKSKQEDNIK